MPKKQFAQELGTGVAETFNLSLSKKAPNNPSQRKPTKEFPKKEHMARMSLELFPQIFIY